MNLRNGRRKWWQREWEECSELIGPALFIAPVVADDDTAGGPKLEANPGHNFAWP